jgi:hypothetical protein
MSLAFRCLLALAFAVVFAANCLAQDAPLFTGTQPHCGANPFNRDAAEPFTVALTDWHCDACKPTEWCRAGCPQTLRRHAVASNHPHFWGWWVGGGTAIGGEGPCENDGTWGWDYEGGIYSRRVWLNWSHGRRYQGGTGAYKTDGPKLELHE